jgi:hypothetical protein
VTVRDIKRKAYTISKNAGSQFHLLLDDAEPMDYFSLFFSDELLNNIVVEKKGMRDKKFRNFSLARDPFGVVGLMFPAECFERYHTLKNFKMF